MTTVDYDQHLVDYTVRNITTDCWTEECDCNVSA